MAPDAPIVMVEYVATLNENGSRETSSVTTAAPTPATK